ncbi:MAG: hypothetical protein QM725_02755 [Lacibacter sp.]
MYIKEGFILVMMLCLFSAEAQKKAAKGNLVVNAQLALLNGDDETDGQITLTPGYGFKNWVIGAGTGFDYYKYRTVPVFADVKRYFGTGSRKMFVYGNIGLDVPWPTSEQKMYRNSWWGASESRFKNGVYTDVGFGYTLFSNKNRGFFAAAGYSTKMLTEIYQEGIWNGTTTIQTTRSLEYTMNRFLFRVGYKF